MIIFDLDGTLTDAEHRRHFLAKFSPSGCPFGPGEGESETRCGPGPDGLCRLGCRLRLRPDWRAFHLASAYDPPRQPVVDILVALSELHPPYEIAIWSGRPAAYGHVASAWLKKHVSPKWESYVSLRMRPDDENNVPDEVLKESWLDEVMTAGRRVEYVFDDRNKVVAMWRRRGITCFQVAEGNF